MAITNVSDVKIYNEQMQAGYIETAQQFTEAFNAASNGAIVMTAQSQIGNYDQAAFFTDLSSSLVTRQDLTSNSSVTALKLAQDENVRVKVHRKIGPVDATFKSFNMIGENAQQTFSFLLGESIAKAQPMEMLNSGLAAARAAILNNTDMVNDVTGTSGTTTHQNLLGALRKFGDAYSRLACWVMHSSNFYDLGLDAIAESVDSVVANVLQVFTVPSFNKPIVVTDSPSLIITADNPDSYVVLGLAQNAIQLVDSEATNVVFDLITGNEQLEMRIQGEGAYNMGLKGYKWDMTNGGANPTDSALATGSNWDKVASSNKDTAGVALKCVLR